MTAKLNFLLMLLLTTTFSVSVFAQSQKLIHYQGVLENSDGAKYSGTTELQFSLFKTPNSDRAIWSETHENVEVTDGNYAVLLGSQNPLRLSFYEYYLEVKSPDIATASSRIPIAGPGYNWRLSFLFAAYTIVWIAIFLYLLSISRRQTRVISELESLAELQTVKKSVET
ncbi:MAG: CcmD family protein [bacterium]